MIEFVLTWLILSISLSSTILLLWLGLTVALSAERRDWGLWLMVGSLLAASLFFVFHSILISQGLENVYLAAVNQWGLGWLFACVLTFAWYLVVLWYGGYWERGQTAVRKGHRFFLAPMVAMAGIIILSLLVTDPLPVHLPHPATDAEQGQLRFGLLATVYPLFITLCIGLSLDVLRRARTSSRPMGDLARRRARPWLVATALDLLLIGLAVMGGALWFLLFGPWHYPPTVPRAVVVLFAWGDLLISLLVSVAILLLGQAIVAYELFTGRALPRLGLRGNWWRAVGLAVPLGTSLSLAVVMPLPAIFVVLLACVVVIAVYAHNNWHSYVEHERHIATLRPLVAGAGAYQAVVSPPAPPFDAAIPFQALCREVLGAGVAYLGPFGPTAPLIGSPLCFHPHGGAVPPLEELARDIRSPSDLCIPVDPVKYGGARWAVPLWSAQGLIGLFLLGDKRDGGLYAQEEIEVARAGGERLIDMMATARIAERLAALQRRRLAESQIADQRTRRRLHDSILPELHEALLELSMDAREKAMSRLADVHRALSDLLHDLPGLSATREVAHGGLIAALEALATEELAHAFESVDWYGADAAEHCRALPSTHREVLYGAAREAIRNAAKHGRGRDADRALRLSVAVRMDGTLLEVIVEDDGIGLEGSEGTEGQGMLLHSTMLAVIGGAWETSRREGRYTRVRLSVPVGGALENLGPEGTKQGVEAESSADLG